MSGTQEARPRGAPSETARFHLTQGSRQELGLLKPVTAVRTRMRRKQLQLPEKVLVVTGGGAGIGHATVLELLARGARIAAVDLNQEGLNETAALAEAGQKLSLHPVNITDREAVLALPEKVAAAHGPTDGLINIAGIIQPFVHIKDLEFEQIERVMDVNFWGTLNTVKAFLPGLLKRPISSQVNVSSMGAILPVPGQSAYGTSKAAV